jgi:hypothetical protein
MQEENSVLPPPKRTPWNKGKLIGAKPPLLARQYLKATGNKPGEFLFTSRRRPGGAMTTRQYARLVSERPPSSQGRARVRPYCKCYQQCPQFLR